MLNFVQCVMYYIFVFELFRQQIIIDPEEKEESIINGKLMMAFNIHNEVCCVQMNGGVCIDYEQVYSFLLLFPIFFPNIFIFSSILLKSEYF